MGLKDWIIRKCSSFKKSRFYIGLSEKATALAIKISIIVIALLSLYIIFFSLKTFFVSFLQSHPLVNSIYTHIAFNITNKTLLGLFYGSFFGGIFFITIPFEFLVLYYLSIGQSLYLVMLISVVGGVLGLFVDYLLGFVMGKRLLKYLFKSKYGKMKSWSDKYGGLFIFIGTFLPSPIEIGSVVFGSTRYSVKKFFLYSFAGRILKVAVLYLIFGWFKQSLLPLF